jgi:hypothetical protein
MPIDRDDIYILRGASHALRSYQHGNSAPGPAKEFADRLDEMCERGIAQLSRREVRLEAEQAGMCTRDHGHDGPCNGFPRPVCATRAITHGGKY